MHVRDLPPRERIQLARGLLRRGQRPFVDLLRLGILPEVVAGDDQVQRRLGVGGVDAERLLEHRFGLGQASLLVIDDAQHVVDVRVGRLLAQHFGQVGDGLGVLAGQVVGAPARDQLTQAAAVGISHWGGGASARAAAASFGCGVCPVAAR